MVRDPPELLQERPQPPVVRGPDRRRRTGARRRLPTGFERGHAVRREKAELSHPGEQDEVDLELAVRRK